jgi:ribulose-phosphate 3-epimerase
MDHIVPGILEKTWEEVEAKIRMLSPFAKSLHIDVIDGKFVNNLTFLDPAPFAKYKDQFLLEAHLMVDEPINYLDAFAKAGFRRFVGHIEKMSSQEEFVAKGELLGEVGLALDGPTPLSAIKVPFDDLDQVTMYVSERVGFSGPPMLPQRLDRVKELRKISDIPIEVDGGVKDITIKMAHDAGATRFVATSFISTAPDPKVAYEKLESLIIS